MGLDATMSAERVMAAQSVGQVVVKYRRHLLACRVLDAMGAVVLPRGGYLARVTGAVGIIAAGTFLLLWLMTVLEGGDFSEILFATMFAAITPALALGMVAWLFPYSVRVLEETFDGAGVATSVSKKVNEWLDQVTRTRDQGLFIAAATAGVLALMVSIEASGVEPFPIYWSSYLAMAFAGIALSQGAYWALVVPTCVGVIKRFTPEELQIFRLNPSKSPSLVGFARVMNVYSLASAMITTLVLLTILSLQPSLEASGTWSMLIVLGIGYLATTYLFFVPHLSLSSIVRREKTATIRELQERANALLKRSAELTESEWAELNRIVELTNRLDSSKNTVVDFSGVRSYALSVAAPTATYILSQAGWLAVVARIGN